MKIKTVRIGIALALTLMFATTVSVCAQVQGGNGLDVSERAEFYHKSEGSEVIPLTWLKALNSSVTKKRFFQNIERFGLITDPSKPDELPIGLSSEESRDTKSLLLGKMVGVNCAACHVSEITYQGNSLRIDGAPNRFNAVGFFDEIAASLKATIKNPIEFLGFLTRLGEQTIAYTPIDFLSTTKDVVSNTVSETITKAVPAKPDVFEQHITKLLSAETDRTPINLTKTFKRRKEKDIEAEKALKGLPKMFGFMDKLVINIGLLHARAIFLAKIASTKFPHTAELGGRVDAFGNARNIIFDTKYSRAPNAPVSYPHLWGFNEQEWLHWDGNTNSVMERNMGQAIGLGAVVNNSSNASTLLPRNIHQLEVLARQIKAPAWPALFPAIDIKKADSGKVIFAENCSKCHATKSATQFLVEKKLLDIVDPAELEKLDKIGTDPERALSFAEPVGSKEQAKALGKKLRAVKKRAYHDAHIDHKAGRAMEGNIKSLWRTTLKYQRRALDGVWATAPYLHNNSVPTIADLLKAPSARPKYFLIQSREYDPSKIGPVVQQSSTISEFPLNRTKDVFDTTLVGNGNGGHEYGTTLTEEEKEHLLEYLKSL